MGVATVPALTSSVALKRFAAVVVPLAPICSISFGLFGELADVRKSGKRKPTKLGTVMVIVNVALLLQPFELCAAMITEYTAAAVGVPEIIPVAAVKFRPGGNGAALY